jgi:hypothetical protein
VRQVEKDMAPEVFASLSPAGQRVCRRIVADEGAPGVRPHWAPDWDGARGGGSVDNQLHTGDVVRPRAGRAA